MPTVYTVYEFICPCGWEITMVNDKRRFDMLNRLHAKKCNQCGPFGTDLMDTVKMDEPKRYDGVNPRDMTRMVAGKIKPTPIYTVTS